MFHLLILVLHEYKNRKSAAFRGWKQHACVHCGAEYRYLLEGKKSGFGSTPETAQRNADQAARNALRLGLLPRSCPTCGLYQPDMVASRRFRFHFVVFICLLCGLVLAGDGGILGVIFMSQEPVFTQIASWLAAGVVGMALVAHLLVDLKNPNRNPQANLEAGRAAVHNGSLVEVAAGDEKTAREPLVGAAWRPKRQFSLYGILFIALLLTPCGEVLRLANGWPLNRGCDPAVVGPGDRVQIRFPATVASVKGLWRADGSAVILNAANLGVPADVKLDSKKDNWGGQIKDVKPLEENQEEHLWAELTIPDGNQFEGQTLEVKMDLQVTYPKWQAAGYRDTKQTATHMTTIALASEHQAGRTYLVCYLVGGITGLVLTFVASGVLVLRTKALRDYSTVIAIPKPKNQR
jgi:hypothetical protein